MTLEGVAWKKRICGGHKASVKQILFQIDALLGEGCPDLSKLSKLMLSFQEKLKTLKLLDGEMLDLIQEVELTSEIEHANAFKIGICTVIIRIDEYLGEATIATLEHSPEIHESIGSWSSDRVKLPKLVLC